MSRRSKLFYFKFVNAVLKLLLTRDTYLEISGDLNEVYIIQNKRMNRFKLNIWITAQVIRMLWMKFYLQLLGSYIMLLTFLRVAIRNITKHRSFSFINILGLSVSLCCALLILLYVNDECSYDRFFKDSERIYRVVGDISLGGKDQLMATSPCPMGPTMASEFPEVESMVRFRSAGEFIGAYEDKSIKFPKLIFADSTFFKVFSIKLLNGDKSEVLKMPQGAVVSESLARRFFGNENAMGKILRINDSWEAKITGVFQDIPENSHFHCDLIASMVSFPMLYTAGWMGNNYLTYVRLNRSTSRDMVTEKLREFLPRYMGPEFEEVFGVSFTTMIEQGAKAEYWLQPLHDIHLNSHREFELEPNGDSRYVRLFALIALFILLISGINFVNMATAQAASRAKEVGIRKVLGAHRIFLFQQFMAEALILAYLSFGLALGLVHLFLTPFNFLAGKNLGFSSFWAPEFILPALALVTLIGLLSGSYPAVYLSSFHPAAAFQKKGRMGVKSGGMRGGLVIFQFVISMILIISTLVVYKQMQHINRQNLGYDRHHVLIVENAFLLGAQRTAFKNELMKQPEVEAVSISSFLPVPSSHTDLIAYPESDKEAKNQSINTWWVDEDYLDCMEMHMSQGRFFSEVHGTDSLAVILNEAAARYYGFRDPLGERLVIHTGPNHQQTTFSVIGVVSDFNYHSLHEQILPLIILYSQRGTRISIRYHAESAEHVISTVSNIWKRFLPAQTFEYSFMDDRFSSMYRTEEQILTLFSVFALLSILIGCLGLFGLAAFMSSQKTKEIGIRKVLGASFGSIVLLMIQEFLKWVGMAVVISWPISYGLMNKWLQNFAFRTMISWDLFLVSSLIALIITLVTISGLTWKAAQTNPANSLKYE